MLGTHIRRNTEGGLHISGQCVHRKPPAHERARSPFTRRHRRITEHNPGVDGEFVMLAVNSLVTARTYLKFSYVYGYHLSDDKQPFFDWKVKGVEQVHLLVPLRVLGRPPFAFLLQARNPLCGKPLIYLSSLVWAFVSPGFWPSLCSTSSPSEVELWSKTRMYPAHKMLYRGRG